MAKDDRPLVIFGAGRHGRNINDICVEHGRPVQGFLDDTKAVGTVVDGVPVLGGFAGWRTPDLLAACDFIVGVGDNAVRRRLGAEIRAAGGTMGSAVHPDTFRSPSSRIGTGVYIHAYSRLMASAAVGDDCLIEGLCSIGSGCVVGQAVWLGAGCQLTAGARVNDDAFLGASAVVVGPACVDVGSVIGAGGVVTRDIPPDVLAVGVPATVKKQLA